MKLLFKRHKDATFAIYPHLTIITRLICYNNNKINKEFMMKKTIIIFSILCTFLFAKEDYSEMSTQELIAIMGYVQPAHKQEFINELKSRTATMSESEKAKYNNNLGKLNK
jgi:hypothetical protein